jgi:hypothetical protein
LKQDRFLGNNSGSSRGAGQTAQADQWAAKLAVKPQT